MTGSSLGMFNRGQLTFNIPNFARLEISAGGRAKMKITSGTIPASYGADIGIEKSFLNRAAKKKEKKALLLPSTLYCCMSLII